VARGWPLAERRERVFLVVVASEVVMSCVVLCESDAWWEVATEAMCVRFLNARARARAGSPHHTTRAAAAAARERRRPRALAAADADATRRPPATKASLVFTTISDN
jgi:hypothetical protein